MLRDALTPLASKLAFAVIFTALTASTAVAQSTGKVQGRVVDAETGEPIASAQISIDGTGIGNLSNADGYYFLNEVPAGLHDISAQSIGYREVVVREQRVQGGQTLTQNFSLEPAAVEIEAIEVEGEQNPLVPRDQVSSKSITTGETIDELPLDNAGSIIVLQPGVISTNEGRSIRGSRPGEEAVYVDGVPIRNIRSGETETLELPTNALAQVDVTTGGFSARFGDAQSGVINYATRTGGQEYTGSLQFLTDELAPLNWRSGFNRGEASVGGPIPGVENLTFFVAGTAEGRSYAALNQEFDDIPFYYAEGVDTTIRLPRASEDGNTTDSIDFAIPNFVEWDNGSRAPTSQSDEYNVVSKLSYGLGGGSRLDLSYYRNRDQSLNQGGLSGIFNPQGWNAFLATQDALTLSGRFVAFQSSDQSLAFDVKASYQKDFNQSGDVDKQWLRDNLSPTLGFNFSSPEFLLDPDDYPINDAWVELARSNALPADETAVLPGRSDLDASTGLEGVDQNIRYNPYGTTNFNFRGVGDTNQNYSEETRWYFSGTTDWQMNRFNRLQVGGELTLADGGTMSVPLFDGQLTAVNAEPTRAGAYIQDRLDIGDVVLEGGLRWDYFDPAGDFPRIPGFVFNVPDSLRADRVRLASGDGSFTDRVEPLEDCGGADTEAQRTREDGTVVCKNNFIEAGSRTTWSPRLAVAFPVTAASTFRLSYGHNVQVPAAGGGGGALFDAVFTDFDGGGANTNTLFGRDVDIPRTVLFEAGYRQLFGEDLVLDVSTYSKSTRNALGYRKEAYPDPVTGSPTNINVLTNADFTLQRGVDLRLNKQFGDMADLSTNYSFINAKGTGSDPFTYTQLILRRNSNLSVLTGQPIIPPELLLTLDQNRTHNLSGTFSLRFPSDYSEGSTLGTVLSDVGIFATARAASGLPYTLLENANNGQTGPPTRAGLGGELAEGLNSSRTPWFRSFDLRIDRGFALGDNRIRAFADLRNPLNFENTNEVWMETGGVTHEGYREEYIDTRVRDITPGTQAEDVAIMLEDDYNEVNKHLLMRAEERFGNGDGVFTVEEQRNAVGSQYQVFNGPQAFRNSDQRLRFGVEFIF